MAWTILPVGLIVAVIITIASIRVKQVTVLLLFRFPATGLSAGLFLLAIPLSATVLVSLGSIFVGVTEIRSITGVFGDVYRLLFYDACLPNMGCSSMPVG